MRQRARSLAPVAVLVVAIVAVAVLAGPGRDGSPLDPNSTGPAGTKGLVDSLAELGADVRVRSRPSEDTEITLVLADILGPDERDQLLAWTRRGGRLVVTDPTSELTPEAVGTATVAGIGQVPMAPDCDLAALRGVEEVAPSAGALVMEVPPGSVGCFPRADGHWLVATPEGEGTIVALGGPEVLVNARLGASGHAELIGALLVPADRGEVTIMRPPRPGEGDASLGDLVPGGVRMALVQLGIAFLVLVAWRARRLGRPVEEPQPVELPGSELVVAVGNLLHQADSRAEAARLLRSDLRRWATERFGYAIGAPVEVLAPALAARTGRRAEEVARLLAGPAPASDADLVTLSAELERLRADVLRPATALK